VRILSEDGAKKAFADYLEALRAVCERDFDTKILESGEVCTHPL
jgi:hypothetical protein